MDLELLNMPDGWEYGDHGEPWNDQYWRKEYPRGGIGRITMTYGDTLRVSVQRTIETAHGTLTATCEVLECPEYPEAVAYADAQAERMLPLLAVVDLAVDMLPPAENGGGD
jgi:hypothetical protein